MIAALIGFGALFALAAVGIPLAVAMTLAGFGGLVFARGWGPAVASVSQTIFETGFNYPLSVIPLFVLMGNLVVRSGMAQELFLAAHAFIGHRRGGLAMATIFACGGFGAICGSAVATAATMTRVAFPEMKRYHYSDALASGTIAAGGTLGILIPPSTMMVIYGITTETNIGKLFVAGIVPGLLAIVLLCLAVAVVTARDPDAGPPAERTPWRERWRALRPVWAVAALFALVIGGIYGGIFTATEGAGVGAGGAFLLAAARRSLTRSSLFELLIDSARSTAMLFALVIAAGVFASFINFTDLPIQLKHFVLGVGAHPLFAIGAMMLIYVVLGTFMEELSMVLLTLPVFFPIVIGLGFDPIWFGVLIVCVVEIGMISPPVGMNLFVVQSNRPGLGIGPVFRGVLPFVAADLLRLGLLVGFPILSLWLPGFMQ